MNSFSSASVVRAASSEGAGSAKSATLDERKMPMAPPSAVGDGPLVVDPEMRRVFDTLTQVAKAPLPVLVLGETGTGKEGAAEWLHAQSGRSGRFVKVNCASLSESVLESELFGHERGAFTGAAAQREGLVEAAHGGTLLLDEIGEFGLRAQAKLLRVLETGEIVRVGSTQPRRVDFRLVASTHRNLPEMVARGEFREDLYYRLSGLTVTLPALRDRPSEIVPLALLFLGRVARAMNRPSWLLGAEAAAALLRHGWPGNVRELRNAVNRAAALCPGNLLRSEHFALRSSPLAVLSSQATPAGAPSSATSLDASNPGQGAPRSPATSDSVPMASSGSPSSPPSSEPSSSPSLPAETPAPTVNLRVRDELRAFERERILVALAKTGGNQTRAAEVLGITRRTLTNKLNAYAIERPRKRPKPQEPEQ